MNPMNPMMCRYMKILIVGENGLGRTTFVRNLFSSCECAADRISRPAIRVNLACI